jgi:hypothetical protein
MHIDLAYSIPGGIIGALILILDIIVIYEVVDSSRPLLNKVLWGVGVLLFPVLGVIVYFLFERRRGDGHYERLLPS